MVSARYVMVESTAWSDSSLRTWLKEFQIYGSVDDPSPTSTPTPTNPTPTPQFTPTPTDTPTAGTSLHIGDLDGSSSPASKNRWDAEVLITIHNATEMAFSNATVSGAWSGGALENGACVTDIDGQCSLTLKNLKSNVNSVIFTITDISADSAQYETVSNHDPDGDSDGTSITVIQP
jgi:hypothetical protein